MYPKDCWYVAAWANEISDKPLGRILLNEPVVLLRDADGAVHALEDRCCHRKVRLSGGKMLGDRLQCPYHGMEYDFNGTCVRVPGQSEVPAGARIKKYVVVEKWKLIWIWMGDPDKADVSSIPDWWQLDHPEWAFPKGNVLHVNCNYQLLIDNILDQSHVNYVHAATLGTQEVNDVPASISKIADGVRCTSWVLGCPPAPFHTKFGITANTVDRWHISEAVLPCYVLIELGAAPAGTGADQGNRSEALVLRAFSAAVPETATTSHKFFAHARRFKLDSPEVDEMFAVRFVKVSLEDNEILEEQQKMVDMDPSSFRVDIRADAAGLQFRKLLKQRIDARA
jgi:phenylpropionate dioxygenase-like ring-hydroxylating dioxygenase large terminal subunit